MGVFSRVGVFSRDYGKYSIQLNFDTDQLRYMNLRFSELGAIRQYICALI